MQPAVFLCKTFTHAALYALGKTLKGKTTFAVTPRRLLIVGNFDPTSGYVYLVDVRAIEGPRNQYAYPKKIMEFTLKKVFLKTYLKNIKRFESVAHLKSYLKI